MAEHSERAKRNTTNSMLADLEFLEKNLEKKEKRLQYWMKFKIYKLRGFHWTITKCQNGIDLVKSQITDKIVEIKKMQENEEIFIIV